MIEIYGYYFKNGNIEHSFITWVYMSAIILIIKNNREINKDEDTDLIKFIRIIKENEVKLEDIDVFLLDKCNIENSKRTKRKYINLLKPSLNRCKRDRKQYQKEYQKNHQLQYQKQYREINKIERAKRAGERIKCSNCDIFIRRDKLTKHKNRFHKKLNLKNF